MGKKCGTGCSGRGKITEPKTKNRQNVNIMGSENVAGKFTHTGNCAIITSRKEGRGTKPLVFLDKKG